MESRENTETLTVEELEHLMDLSECAMFIVKPLPEFTLQYANKKFYQMTQYTEKEFSEKFHNSFMAVILPEEVQKIRNLIARQSAAGGRLQLEFRIRRKDGVNCWVSMTAKSTLVNGQMLYYCSCMDVTQQKRHLNDIYNAKREVDLITNNVPGGVLKISISDYRILYANDGFFTLAGYNRAEYHSLFGNQVNKVIYPDDVELVQRMIKTSVDNRVNISFEYRIVAKSGEIRWSYVNGCRVDDIDGEIVYLCIITDITARKKLEEKYKDNVCRSDYLLNLTHETEWTYLIAEEKLHRSGYLKGTYSEQQEIDGAGYRALLEAIVHPEDIKAIKQDFEKRIKYQGNTTGIYRMKDRQGNYRTCKVSMISTAIEKKGKPEKIYGKTQFLENRSYLPKEAPAFGADESKPGVRQTGGISLNSAEQEDTVSGLMSYDELLGRIKEVLDNREESEMYGILCCDINEFSKVNYHYGISIGNKILQGLAAALKEKLAYQEICCRINGDYFIVFFCYENHQKLLKTISQMLRFQSDTEEQQKYSTYGTTNGIYLIQPEDSDISQMIERADLARRSIKGIYGNHYAIYTDELEENRFWEEEAIRVIGDSMSDNTVEICYLPRIQGDRENVIGCKATPRIQMKNGSYLQLEDLRRYIDRSEDMQQLVFYVLSRVCCNQGAWKSQGRKIIPISVDITPGQLCLRNAVFKINEIVEQNNLSPSDIIFEVQEQYFKEFSINFQMALEDLCKLGYRIVISRFGSHHTAIHTLRQLPISGIKFHGEFFHENMISEKERYVFCKIVEMVKGMGLFVGCGGIHTELQEEFARSIGCDILEGDMYYGTLSNDVYEKCFLK